MDGIRELHNATEVGPEEAPGHSEVFLVLVTKACSKQHVANSVLRDSQEHFKPRKSQSAKPQGPQRAFPLLLSPARTGNRPENQIL